MSAQNVHFMNVLRSSIKKISCPICSILKPSNVIYFFRACGHFYCTGCLGNSNFCLVCNGSDHKVELKTESGLVDLYNMMSYLKEWLVTLDDKVLESVQTLSIGELLDKSKASSSGISQFDKRKWQPVPGSKGEPELKNQTVIDSPDSSVPFEPDTGKETPVASSSRKSQHNVGTELPTVSSDSTSKGTMIPDISLSDKEMEHGVASSSITHSLNNGIEQPLASSSIPHSLINGIEQPLASSSTASKSVKKVNQRESRSRKTSTSHKETEQPMADSVVTSQPHQTAAESIAAPNFAADKKIEQPIAGPSGIYLGLKKRKQRTTGSTSTTVIDDGKEPSVSGLSLTSQTDTPLVNGCAELESSYPVLRRSFRRQTLPGEEQTPIPKDAAPYQSKATKRKGGSAESSNPKIMKIPSPSTSNSQRRSSRRQSERKKSSESPQVLGGRQSVPAAKNATKATPKKSLGPKSPSRSRRKSAANTPVLTPHEEKAKTITSNAKPVTPSRKLTVPNRSPIRMVTPKNSKPESPGLRKLSIRKNPLGENLFHAAVKRTDLRLVKELIDAGVEDINHQDHAGWTPLHDATQEGLCPIVEVLLKNGASVNVPGHRNVTALHIAAEKGNACLIKLLLNHRADPNAKDITGNTPIHWALKPEIKELLKKPPLNQEKPTPAAPAAPPEKVAFILKLPVVEMKSIQPFFKKFLIKQEKGDIYKANIVIVSKNSEWSCFDWGLCRVMARGAIIVTSLWCDESMVSDELKDPTNYKIEPPWLPGLRQAQENARLRHPGLFCGINVFISKEKQRSYRIADGSIDLMDLGKFIEASGGTLLTRPPDPEDNLTEKTVPFHAKPGVMAACYLIHIYLKDSQLKYNMAHLKSLPIEWIIDCITHFQLLDDVSKYF